MPSPRFRPLRLVATLTALGLAASSAAEERKPAWQRGLEVASPYAGAASDVYGGASGVVDAAKDLRASDVERELGNRLVRKALAAEHDSVLAKLQGTVKVIEKYRLGTATTVVDIGSTALAHVVEGDLRSLPGVAANAGAKIAVGSGGAWAGGASGAALGSLAGPVGTLVGGAIGAGLGALGASWGYDTASEALRENGYGDVQTYVDGLVAEDARAAFRQAQQNRRDWLVERGLAPVVGGDPGFVKPPPEPAAPSPAMPASIIPDDCTIEVVLWHRKAPEGKWRGTFRVSGNTVTGRGEYHRSAEQGPTYRRGPMHTIDEFTGTRNDNVLTGTSHGGLQRTWMETWSAPDAQGRTHHCRQEWTTSTTTRDEWTFLPGGEGRLRASGTLTSHTQFSGDCGNHPASDTSTSAIEPGDQRDVVVQWKVR